MALIDDAKDYLQITWDDDVLTRKLENAIPRGMELINGYAGVPLDYDNPGVAQGLLFDFLRYVRSDATEMFEGNYAHDLIHLRQQAFVEASKDAEN